MAKEFSLSDVLLNAGIENEEEYIEYADKDNLADESTEFSISKIEEVESVINKSGKQWCITIHYTDYQGVDVTEFLNLDPDKQRDAKINAIKASLEASKGRIIKGCKLVKIPLRNKGGRSRFDIRIA